jgi:hypothetical protein
MVFCIPVERFHSVVSLAPAAFQDLPAMIVLKRIQQDEQPLTMLRGYTGQTCFQPFSFADFTFRLTPWLWADDITTHSDGLGETTTHLKLAATAEKTDTPLSVTNSDLSYLTQEEAEQIIAQFKSIPNSSNRLLFWTGIPRDWVQKWANEHRMLTLTSAMGPLMDVSDPRCPKHQKGTKTWKKYINGASGIFARYACESGIVRVLTLPPSRSEFLRPTSAYRTIEEPVLKGWSGCCCAMQINFVHLLVGSGELEYQIWPEDNTSEKLKWQGSSSTFEYRIPRWISKALKANARSQVPKHHD